MSRFRGIDQSAEEARRKQPRRERETERQRDREENLKEFRKRLKRDWLFYQICEEL
jgi:hypothetical protein